MTVFVDTSAIYPLLSASDQDHRRASLTFARLLETEEDLLTTNYVLVESAVLIATRLSIRDARTLHERIVPVFRVHWVDADLHRESVAAWFAGGRRRISLVDWVSFALMRKERVGKAFAFDPDFTAQGFELIG